MLNMQNSASKGEKFISNLITVLFPKSLGRILTKKGKKKILVTLIRPTTTKLAL